MVTHEPGAARAQRLGAAEQSTAELVPGETYVVVILRGLRPALWRGEGHVGQSRDATRFGGEASREV